MTIVATAVSCNQLDEQGYVFANPATVLATVSVVNAESQQTTVTIRASRLVTNTQLQLDRKDVGPLMVYRGTPVTVTKSLAIDRGHIGFEAFAIDGTQLSNTVTSNVQAV
jgi:hypothetical protein